MKQQMLYTTIAVEWVLSLRDLFEATLKCHEACDLGLIYVFSILLLFLANNHLFY